MTGHGSIGVTTPASAVAVGAVLWPDEDPALPRWIP